MKITIDLCYTDDTDKFGFVVSTTDTIGKVVYTTFNAAVEAIKAHLKGMYRWDENEN